MKLTSGLGVFVSGMALGLWLSLASPAGASWDSTLTDIARSAQKAVAALERISYWQEYQARNCK